MKKTDPKPSPAAPPAPTPQEREQGALQALAEVQQRFGVQFVIVPVECQIPGAWLPKLVAKAV